VEQAAADAADPEADGEGKGGPTRHALKQSRASAADPSVASEEDVAGFRRVGKLVSHAVTAGGGDLEVEESGHFRRKGSEKDKGLNERQRYDPTLDLDRARSAAPPRSFDMDGNRSGVNTGQQPSLWERTVPRDAFDGGRGGGGYGADTSSEGTHMSRSAALVQTVNLARPAVKMSPVSARSRRESDIRPENRPGPSRMSAFSDISSSFGYNEDDEEVEQHLTLESRFFRAAYYGDLSTAKRYTKTGAADINALSGEYFDKNDPLHMACSRGFTDIVSFLLNAECKEHRRNLQGETALFLAAKNGHLECAKKVSQAGAKREQADKFGRTPLFIAAENGHLDLVRYLNETGASKYKHAKDGRTALYAACENGHLNVVLYLLQASTERERKGRRDRSMSKSATSKAPDDATRKKDSLKGARAENGAAAAGAASDDPGANLGDNLSKHVEYKDRPDKLGITPLAVAAKRNHPDVVRYLLKLGALKEKANNFGHTPLMMAAQHQDISMDVVEALLEAGASVNCKDERQQTPLYKAAMTGNADAVQLLLRNRAKVDDVTDEGLTPLHIAALRGHPEVIDIILGRKGNPNAETITGATPLQLAAAGGHLDTLLKLQQAANNVNKEDEDGATPLMVASRGGHVTVVRSLLRSRADFNKTSTGGATALTMAAENGHTEVVRMLLRAGANVNHGNSRGETPLARAAANGHIDSADALLSWPKCLRDEPNHLGDSPLHVACLVGHVDLFIFMIDSGCDKNYVNGGGESVLHVACRRGLLAVVRHLINAEADKNKAVAVGRSKSEMEELILDEPELAAELQERHVVTGDTPLIVATRFGHLQIVQYLLACGADKEAVNAEGETPLIVACRLNRDSIVQHLIKLSVNLEVKNNESVTALAWACAEGHENVVRTLCSASAVVDAHGYQNETPLFSAARRNRVSIIRALTEDFKANVIHQSENGKTALYVGCEEGMSEAVVALLEAPGGTKALEMEKSGGWTPVHIAAYMGRADITQHIFSNMAVNLNRVTDTGSTPLYLAAQQGKVDIVKQLCDVDRHKLDINHRQRKDGPTPLIIAAKHGHLDVCDLLVKANADINAETGIGVNAVHTAAFHRHNPVLRLLIDAGAHPLSQKTAKSHR